MFIFVIWILRNTKIQSLQADGQKTEGTHWLSTRVFSFGLMYLSVALVQTTDLDLREELNWSFNESNRCDHRRLCELPASARALYWATLSHTHTVQPRQAKNIWELYVMLVIFKWYAATFLFCFRKTALAF